METQRVATRYELAERLGSGGVAVVHWAQDVRLDRPCALKILREQYAQDPEFLRRFEREARIAAGLNHPNLVAVYDYGPVDRTFFIVMEYVPGGSLKDEIRAHGPLNAREAVRIAREVLSGLTAAHAHGLVHRDVKPQNVLLTADRTAKLGDFGIAHSPATTQLTQQGFTLGTAAYVAPEQAQGHPAGPAADVYGVGLLLYEMLVGRPPFQGDSAPAVVYQQVHERPVPPGELVAGVSPALDAVIARALEKEPTQRFPSAEAMFAALGEPAVLDAWNAPVAATAAHTVVIPPASRTAVMPPVAAAPSAASAAAPPIGLGPVAAASPRPRWLFRLLALALGLLVLAAAYAALAGRGSSPPSLAPVATLAAPTAVATAAPTQPTSAPTQQPTAALPTTVPAAPPPAAVPTREPSATAAPQPTATLRPPSTATARPQPTATVAAPTATTGPAKPTAALAKPVAATGGTIVLEDTAFSGGWRNDGPSVYRQRTATWVYAANTPYSTMIASFDLPSVPAGGAMLTVTGLSSEHSRPDMALLVNGTRVFAGPSPFQSDTMSQDFENAPAPWTEVRWNVPASLLRAGQNTIAISNLEPDGAVNRPPFVMVDRAMVEPRP